jgi:hypothetical protein
VLKGPTSIIWTLKFQSWKSVEIIRLLSNFISSTKVFCAQILEINILVDSCQLLFQSEHGKVEKR